MELLDADGQQPAIDECVQLMRQQVLRLLLKASETSPTLVGVKGVISDAKREFYLADNFQG